MPIVAKGYSRKAASNWYELVKKDQKRYAKKYTKQKLRYSSLSRENIIFNDRYKK